MALYKFFKNSKGDIPKNISLSEYNQALFGQELLYEPQQTVIKMYHFSEDTFEKQDYKILNSLKNFINSYSAIDDIFDFKNFYQKTSLLMCFNSMFLGSGIEPGTVKLDLYYTGSLVASASDLLSNGVLYDKEDNKIGCILYKEGFLIINDNSVLNEEEREFSTLFDTYIDNLKWTNSYSKCDSSYYFNLDYSLKNEVITNTYFIHANKNELNHSNNNTYIKSGSYWSMDNNTFFIENDKIEIKNTVKSPFNSGSANFEKQTFITSIGLFDEDKKLIAEANLANPVRKTEDREFLFKLKLDI